MRSIKNRTTVTTSAPTAPDNYDALRGALSAYVRCFLHAPDTLGSIALLGCTAWLRGESIGHRSLGKPHGVCEGGFKILRLAVALLPGAATLAFPPIGVL